MTGVLPLARLAVRRDRIGLPVCVYVIVILVVTNAYEFKKLYPTRASRTALAASSESNPALRFLYGTLDGTSIGSITTWRIGVWAAMFAALAAIFLVIRHTRADEEAGRLELVGSAAVSRAAALVAALAVAAATMVLVVVLLCAVLPLVGLTFAGSALLALSIGACGLAFAGIAAAAAQLTTGARAARGIALTVLGAAFVLRGSGDAGVSSGTAWLTWTSPLGWVELGRPFGASSGSYAGVTRWWVLCLPLALCALGVAAAFALAARRDLGAGLIPDRPGRPAASAALRGPLGLAWRLQRGTLLGWLAGYAAMFAICGAAAQGIGQLVGTSSALRSEFTRLGGQSGSTSGIVDAYLAALMLLAGVIANAYAVSAVLRLRSEEMGELAEPVLATAVGRVRWALSHIFVAGFGSALLLAVAGVATGLGYGLRAGSAGTEVGRMLGAGVSQLPAVLVVAGVAVLAFGLVPRWSVPGMWTLVGLLVLLQLFGPVLRFSHWVMDVSPFSHVPRLPGGTVQARPLTWLCAVAVVFLLAGLDALRHRDVGY
jgi:polyether ionophore transport system permease protein